MAWKMKSYLALVQPAEARIVGHDQLFPRVGLFQQSEQGCDRVIGIADRLK
jgi:hypothetical protein